MADKSKYAGVEGLASYIRSLGYVLEETEACEVAIRLLKNYGGAMRWAAQEIELRNWKHALAILHEELLGEEDA